MVNYNSKVKAAEIKLWNHLKVGDEMIVQGPTTGSVTGKVESIQVEGENIQKADKHNVGVFFPYKVRPGDLVYRRYPKDCE